jgi:hypothetical protein
MTTLIVTIHWTTFLFGLVAGVALGVCMVLVIATIVANGVEEVSR